MRERQEYGGRRTINGEERRYNGFAGQIQVRHQAVVTAYATVPALLAELKRSGLFPLAAHPRGPMRQRRAALQAARQS